MQLEDFRLSTGEFGSFTSVGSYPIVYYTEDGAELCPDCVNGKNGSEAFTGPHRDAAYGTNEPRCFDDAQWHVIGADVYWEGPAIPCAHCGKGLESAYGDPEADHA